MPARSEPFSRVDRLSRCELILVPLSVFALTLSGYLDRDRTRRPIYQLHNAEMLNTTSVASFNSNLFIFLYNRPRSQLHSGQGDAYMSPSAWVTYRSCMGTNRL